MKHGNTQQTSAKRSLEMGGCSKYQKDKGQRGVSVPRFLQHIIPDIEYTMLCTGDRSINIILLHGALNIDYQFHLPSMRFEEIVESTMQLPVQENEACEMATIQT